MTTPETGHADSLGPELAPGLDRYSLRVWLHPMFGIPIVPEYVTRYLEATARVCKAFVFAGPVCVAGDQVLGLENILTHPNYQPRDVNGFVWWIDENAPNALAILNHSHAVFYYYPEHNLVDLTVETCSPIDPERVLAAVYAHWLPKKDEMQYDFRIVRQGIPYIPSEQDEAKAGQLRWLRLLLSRLNFSKSESILPDGRELERLILYWKQTQTDDLSTFLIPRDLVRLQELYALYEGQIEQQIAAEIIAGRIDERAFPFYERYRRLTEQEAYYGGIKQNTRVAFIGGGWLPISAILYARMGARVTVYEKEPDRAEIARQVVDKLGLGDKIKIVCAEAEREMQYHDVYVIAALALPKAEILANIRRTVDFDERIVVRTTHHDNQLFYQAATLNNLPGYVKRLRSYAAQIPDDIISFVVVMLKPVDTRLQDRTEFMERYAELTRSQLAGAIS